jgi:hypothetical protein
MTCTNGRINDIYKTLCNITRNPRDFGLGESVPGSLADALEGVLCTLSQIQREQVFDEGGDMAAGLSQDADRPSVGRPKFSPRQIHRSCPDWRLVAH